MNGSNNETPISYAVAMHDQEIINVLVNHLAKDANQLEYFDTEYMIENFTNAWKNNFTFQNASFTAKAHHFIRHNFSGTIKRGKEIVFSEKKLIKLSML